MSATRISTSLRRLVAARARRRCEYCRIHESDTVFGCQVDHVVSEKHGGATEAENLAYACVFCNRHKGSDIAALDETGKLVALFNPRRDAWAGHFAFDGARLAGLTPAGRATIRLLRMNAPERVIEREILLQAGRLQTE
jgi:HNH endonuclease